MCLIKKRLTNSFVLRYTDCSFGWLVIVRAVVALTRKRVPLGALFLFVLGKIVKILCSFIAYHNALK